MACAARRWLARNAAGVKHLYCSGDTEAPACTSLVPCLPALEKVTLGLGKLLDPGDLGCLLEALAWCPRLRALQLSMCGGPGLWAEGLGRPFPDAFGQLRSLTELMLAFNEESPYTLAGVVDALVPLTGLAELSIGFHGPTVVPAALGQLKGLRSLKLCHTYPCVLNARCLELPNLQSLDFRQCCVKDGEVLPSVTALQCLTRIEFTGDEGPFRFDPKLVQIPVLQRIVISQDTDEFGRLYNMYDGVPPRPLRLPADMGLLRLSLLHLNISGLRITVFPIALTQLAALEYLNANRNAFAELPAAITALSRLRELRLGRVVFDTDPVQLRAKLPLDARSLGDLSGFLALHKLTFGCCEVMLCPSMLGAVHHVGLTTLRFWIAHAAPKCELMVLQLSKTLWSLGRGSVVKCMIKAAHHFLMKH